MRTQGKLSLIDKEWDLFPTYIKYGTTNCAALLLMILHAEEREMANEISIKNKLIPKSSYDWLRVIGWTLYITSRKESSQKIKDNILQRLNSLKN